MMGMMDSQQPDRRKLKDLETAEAFILLVLLTFLLMVLGLEVGEWCLGASGFFGIWTTGKRAKTHIENKAKANGGEP
jgi:hypothetical protein